MKLFCLLAILAATFIAQAANAVASEWEQPAATLAEQIAAILGPGQAHLTIRNISKIPAEENPSIRRALEGALWAQGIILSGAEGANAIRVTLSENLRERLWIAEIVEGNETRLAMVRVEQGTAHKEPAESGVRLHKQTVLTATEPVLAALETADSLILVEPEEIVIFAHSVDGWQEQSRVGIGQKRPLSRDPRGVIFPSRGGQEFEAWVAGMACAGSYQNATPPAEWTVHCRESDDPWLVTQSPFGDAEPSTDANVRVTPIRAFYNAGRNYFTGVVTASLGVDVPPFYSAVLLPRPNGAGLLINGVDGKVQLFEAAALKSAVPTDRSSSVGLKSIAGTRDWGSDFAVLNSGCKAGTQIIASGSGEAAADSLRAYELPAQEAIPASAPLAMDGMITAVWTAPDAESVFVVVRRAADLGQKDRYEVDRVTANCN